MTFLFQIRIGIFCKRKGNVGTTFFSRKEFLIRTKEMNDLWCVEYSVLRFYDDVGTLSVET